MFVCFFKIIVLIELNEMKRQWSPVCYLHEKKILKNNHCTKYKGGSAAALKVSPRFAWLLRNKLKFPQQICSRNAECWNSHWLRASEYLFRKAKGFIGQGSGPLVLTIHSNPQLLFRHEEVCHSLSIPKFPYCMYGVLPCVFSYITAISNGALQTAYWCMSSKIWELF